MKRTAIFTLCVCLVAFAQASAQEWGSLKGRFVYDGKAPEPPKLNITKDVEVCSKHAPVDESLVVGKDGGLANVVIYVRTKPGQKLAVHPDYAATASDKIKMDNQNCRFDPHVVGLRTSQTLVLGNADSVPHNSKIEPLKNPAANPIIPPTQTSEYKFSAPEAIPVKVSCSIHPWMSGLVVARPDPYFAITGEDGSFEIKNLPAGEHEFQVWQEKAGNVSAVSLNGKPATWKTGRFTHKVAAGDNDLGEIKVKPDLFKSK